ncbi:MAG: ABC transporter ATP-binding protein [Candidatus Limivivens sp.]|nr:ABC transporter ATP-binding protein [Candidatus Limivivens sp.]
MAAMVEIKDLVKNFSFSQGIWAKDSRVIKAVDEVSFSIEEGEIVGLVGESGSGKTTLARVILGLTPMTSGRVVIDGIDLAKAGKKDRDKLHREIAVVFQDPVSNLNPRQTVEGSIMRPMLLHNIPRAEAGRRAKEVLDMVKMDERYLDCYPHQLSGGQLQRIAIARALALSPKIMILDEPTSALDVSIQAQIFNLLLDLQEQMHLTYLVITHDLNAVKYISDRIAVMYLGKLVEFGSTEEVTKHPQHPYTRGLMRAAPILDPRMRGRKKETIDGEPGSMMDLGTGCRFYARCRYATPECRSHDPKMDVMGDGHQVACHHPLK